jgi:hypothetical protein
VVVEDGDTWVELPFTFPMPLIDKDVAPLTDQLKVVDWPSLRVDGLAEKDEIAGLTGTGAVPPLVPPPPPLQALMSRSNAGVKNVGRQFIQILRLSLSSD